MSDFNHEYEVDFVVGTTSSVEQYVCEALGEHAEDFDVEAIADDLREEINIILNGDGTLRGDEFFGLSHPDLDVSELVESIDFWTIAEHHQFTE